MDIYSPFLLFKGVALRAAQLSLQECLIILQSLLIYTQRLPNNFAEQLHGSRSGSKNNSVTIKGKEGQLLSEHTHIHAAGVLNRRPSGYKNGGMQQFLMGFFLQI